MEQLQDFVLWMRDIGLFNLLVALLILIVGYIVARLLGGLTRRIFNRIEVDDKVVKRLSADFDLPEIDSAKWAGTIVFWIVILFVVVAAIQQLNMVVLTAAINPLLTTITSEYIPGLVGALLLGLLAWVAAVILRAIVVRLCKLAKLDDRLTQQGAVEEGEQVSVTETLGVLTFWLVILLFIPAILDALGISAIAEPFQEAIGSFFDYLPNIVSATVIFLVGWLLAKVLRQLVTSLLTAVQVVDGLGNRIGLTGEQTLSKLLGTLTYAIIMLMVVIAALDALAIAAISGPATSMLNVILDAIPSLIGAVLVLVIAYYVARLVSQLIVEVLTGLHFDKWPQKLGINYSGERTPSQLVGYLVMLGIVLIAAVGASDLLQSESISAILTQMVDFFFQVVLALVIVGVGLYFANLAADLVKSAGGANGRVWALAARMAILILAITMALRQLGLASDIVNMAFGLILASAALGAALAFGLGGRGVAGQELDRMVTNWRSGSEEAAPAEAESDDS